MGTNGVVDVVAVECVFAGGVGDAADANVEYIGVVVEVVGEFVSAVTVAVGDKDVVVVEIANVVKDMVANVVAPNEEVGVFADDNVVTNADVVRNADAASQDDVVTNVVTVAHADADLWSRTRCVTRTESWRSR